MFYRHAVTIPFLAHEIEVAAPLAFEGLVKNLHVSVPNFTNSVTATVTIEDSSGYVIYNSGALSKNTNNNVMPDIVIADPATLKVTLSGEPGGSGAQRI